VAIGYGLYRGETRVTLSDAVWIPSDRLIVRELKYKACQERKLDPDQTRVFESEGDLLDFVKDQNTGELKVCYFDVVCGFLLAPYSADRL